MDSTGNVPIPLALTPGRAPSEHVLEKGQNFGMENGLIRRSLETRRILRRRKVRTRHDRWKWTLKCVVPGVRNHAVIDPGRVADAACNVLNVQAMREFVPFRRSQQDRNVDVDQCVLGPEPGTGRRQQYQGADPPVAGHGDGSDAPVRGLMRACRGPAARDGERCVATHGMADECDPIARKPIPAGRVGEAWRQGGRVLDDLGSAHRYFVRSTGASLCLFRKASTSARSSALGRPGKLILVPGA